MEKIVVYTWILQRWRAFFLVPNNSEEPLFWAFPREEKLKKNEKPITAFKRWLSKNSSSSNRVSSPSMKQILVFYHNLPNNKIIEERVYHVSELDGFIPGNQGKFYLLNEIEEIPLGFWHKEVFMFLKKWLIEKSRKELKEKIRSGRLHFYSDGKPEDIEAMRLLLRNNVPFVKFGPVSEPETPYLEYSFWKICGLEYIKEFIEDFKAGLLPPLDKISDIV